MLSLLAALALAAPPSSSPSKPSGADIVAVFNELEGTTAAKKNGLQLQRHGAVVVITGGVTCPDPAGPPVVEGGPVQLLVETKAVTPALREVSRLKKTFTVPSCAAARGDPTYLSALRTFRDDAWNPPPPPRLTLRHAIGPSLAKHGTVDDITLDERTAWDLQDDEEAFVVVVDGVRLAVTGAIDCKPLTHEGMPASDLNSWIANISVRIRNKPRRTLVGLENTSLSFMGIGCVASWDHGADTLSIPMDATAAKLLASTKP